MYLVLYDICDNKIRSFIVKFLKDRGMYRLQKSIFAGDIKKNYMNEIILISQKVIEKDYDSFIILKLDKDTFRKIKYFGTDVEVTKYLKEKYVEMV